MKNYETMLNDFCEEFGVEKENAEKFMNDTGCQLKDLIMAGYLANFIYENTTKIPYQRFSCTGLDEMAKRKEEGSPKKVVVTPTEKAFINYEIGNDPILISPIMNTIDAVGKCICGFTRYDIDDKENRIYRVNLSFNNKETNDDILRGVIYLIQGILKETYQNQRTVVSDDYAYEINVIHEFDRYKKVVASLQIGFKDNHVFFIYEDSEKDGASKCSIFDDRRSDTEKIEGILDDAIMFSEGNKEIQGWTRIYSEGHNRRYVSYCVTVKGFPDLEINAIIYAIAANIEKELSNRSDIPGAYKIELVDTPVVVASLEFETPFKDSTGFSFYTHYWDEKNMIAQSSNILDYQPSKLLTNTDRIECVINTIQENFSNALPFPWESIKDHEATAHERARYRIAVTSGISNFILSGIMNFICELIRKEFRGVYPSKSGKYIIEFSKCNDVIGGITFDLPWSDDNSFNMTIVDNPSGD